MFRPRSGLLGLSVLVLAAVGLPARQALDGTWTFDDGSIHDAELVEVRGPMAFFVKDRMLGHFPWSRLIATDRSKVAEFAAAQAAAVVPDWATSDSAFWKRLGSRALDFSGEKTRPFVPRAGAEPDFYVVYFGADWCPPCRRFVPRLNAWYQSRRAMGFENFEVFYMGWDKSASDQARYIRSAKMPFPALRLGSDERLRELRIVRPNSIPGLIVFDRDGFPLYHSHRGEAYRGPEVVLEELHQLLLWSNPDHYLAINQRFEQTKRAILAEADGADQPPRLFHSTPLPAEAFAGADEAGLTFTLTISATGSVTAATPEEALSPALQSAVLEALYGWMFIPAVRDGAFAEVRVRVPLQPTP